MSCINNIPCEQITDLGCYPHCDLVQLGVDLPNGNYRIRAEFMGTIKYFHTDETLTIDPTKLPLDTEILLTFTDFDDEPVLFDDNQYCKIKFKFTTDETIDV